MVRSKLLFAIAPLTALFLLPAYAGNLYEVQRKEGFYSIARKCGVDPRELMGLNPRRDQNKIKVGELLRLPGNANCTTTTLAGRTTMPGAGNPSGNNPGAADVSDTTQPGWRHYGPLKVDWQDWQVMDDHWVTRSMNTENQPLYVAINCPAQRLNQTSGDGQWMAWEAPSETYQQDLVTDLCREKA